MKPFALAGSTAIALVLVAQAALAITPEEVWANWKAAAADAGQQITAAAEAKSGNTLEITDLKSVFPIPDSDLVLTTQIPKVALADMGDGTVSITFSESYPLTISEFGTTASPAGAEIEIGLPGASVIASGTADSVAYTFAMPTLTAKLIKATDADGKPVDASLDGTASGLAGAYVVEKQAGGSTLLDAGMVLEKIDIAAAATNPALSESFKASFSAAGISTKSKGVLLTPEAMEDMAKALVAGFAIDSQTETGALSFSAEFNDASGPNTWSGDLAGLNARIALDKTRVDYGFGMTGGKFAMSVPSEQIPPVDGTFGEIAFRLAGPLAKTDAPQDFSVLVRLIDVAASEAVWAMGGPFSTLPHDPLTAILDMNGKMGWKIDPLTMNDGGMTEVPVMPVLLFNADLTQFLLKFVGAEASATGALTFDNNDLVTWEGIPTPTGTITANMKGVNALIDKLVQIGLLPEDQVMGFRMMLAMFAKPGAGPDELVSEIEFKNKGLFVNGQQIR